MCQSMQSDLAIILNPFNTKTAECQHQTVTPGEYLHTLTFIHCRVTRPVGSKASSLTAAEEPGT